MKELVGGCVGGLWLIFTRMGAWSEKDVKGRTS